MAKIQFTQEEFGWCRTLMHSWTLEPPIERSPDGREITYVARCDRCKATRRDSFDLRTGMLNARTYKLAAGYLFKGLGDNRPSKAEIRSTFFNQLLGEQRRSERAERATPARGTAAGAAAHTPRRRGRPRRAEPVPA